MLDEGERVVEVMQRGTPFLVRRGTPETFGVVLEAFPLHQEQEAPGSLHAALDAQRRRSRAGRNEILRLVNATSTTPMSFASADSVKACGHFPTDLFAEYPRPGSDEPPGTHGAPRDGPVVVKLGQYDSGPTAE